MTTSAATAQGSSGCGGRRVSVILPNFNHAQYLGTALAALLAQVSPADEIIVVDDGSTDGSVPLVRDFAARSRNLWLIENGRNMGTIASLNRGLAAATGTYVYCAAADDQVGPNLFKTLLPLLESEPKAALACGEMCLRQSEAKHVGVRPIVRPSGNAAYLDPAAARHLLHGSDHWIWTGATILRRTHVVECGGFDPELGSMADSFALRRMALAHGFCFVPAVVASSRVNESGLSGRTSRDLEQIAILLEKGRERILRDPAFPPGYADLFMRRLKFAVARLALQDEPPSVEMVTRIAAPSRFDAWLCARLARHGKPGARLALVWLVLRLRPMSLVRALGTAAQRRSEGRHQLADMDVGQ
jgi:glycosyltransferase involved in cell wall biosynthesis